jgi:hypothetical protein
LCAQSHAPAEQLGRELDRRDDLCFDLRQGTLVPWPASGPLDAERVVQHVITQASATVVRVLRQVRTTGAR